MKSAILSINIYTRRLNYGAVLHSWFFQKLMLRRDDIDTCDIMDYTPSEKSDYNPWTHFKPKHPLKHPKRLARYLMLTPGYVRRWRKFQTFFKNYLTISDKRYTSQSLKEGELPYDALFFESDVIWSPRYFGKHFNPAYFGALPGMAKCRKIVYSASMSDARLTDENYQELDELLKYPDAISMRERYASKIIRQHTDKPVQDVLDPVLLAEPEDFDGITAPRLVRKKYVLTYYPIRPDDYVHECAKSYAKERGLKVVEVSLYPSIDPSRRTFTGAGIEEFISLVRNSEAVFCNSLHGVCLAILFHKDFYAFERRGGGLKYKDLCGKFGLEKRFIPKNSYKEDDDPIDWAKVDTQRHGYIRECMDWIDKAIKS